MINQQKQHNNNISGTVIAEVAGVVAIAGAAVAATLALKDKKTRERIKEATGNIKDQAIGYMKHMQDQGQDKKSEVEEKVEKVVNAVKE